MNELWSTVGNKAQEWSSVAGAKAQEWGPVIGAKAQEWSSVAGAKAQEWGPVIGAKAQEYGTIVGNKAHEWGTVAGKSAKDLGKKMSSKKCFVKDFFKRDWTVSEKVLVVFCCILLGMIYGFLIAPVKKGVKIGSDNGNTYNDDGDWWLEDEEE